MNNNSLTFYDRAQDLIEVRLDEERFPRLKDIPTETALPQVKQMVVGAAILRASVLADDMIEMTAGALLQEVKQDFPQLTIPELGKAIRNGCFEKYGTVYGISAVSLYKMVEGYVASEEKAELTRRVRQKKSKYKEELEQWTRDHADYFLQELKKNNQ